MANGLTRVVVREQNPQVRATNFDEVCYGYNKEEAMEEAARCLNCKKPKCVEAVSYTHLLLCNRRKPSEGI